MTTPSSVFDAPPPYPGPSSTFAPPQDETTSRSLDTWAESSRLPPYPYRSARRYSPYPRIFPARQRGSLSHQSLTMHRTVVPHAVVETSPTAPTPLPVQDSDHQAPPPVAPGPIPLLPRQEPHLNCEERHLRILYRILILSEILRIICAELNSVMGIAEALF
ncbi:hypothetical protein E4T56_gene17775 [Termitomyces sp. T112]|nr:hypothetical protein C0989_001859 [Termitomyces sp. Mn162]KAG5728938.1 hypothetical protein E4T56_gene17775 [Termitomyces sp. T112]